jgi:PAS domain S-box-containing protein
VLYANAAALKIAGFTKINEIIGVEPITLIPEAEHALVKAEWKYLLKGQIRTYRHGGLRPDGSLYQVEITTYPKLGLDSRFAGATMIMSDITEAMALEKATHQARRALERESRNALIVANSISDGLAFISKDFVVEYANPAWVKLLGFDSSSSVIGKSSKTWVHEEDVSLLEKYDRILESGQSCQYNYRVRHADGGLFTMENKSFPRVENGVYLGFIAVVRSWVSVKKQSKLASNSLLVLPHLEAALAFIHGVGGEHFFTASIEPQPESETPKLVLRGRGFKLVLLEGDVGQLPSSIKFI